MAAIARRGTTVAAMYWRMAEFAEEDTHKGKGPGKGDRSLKRLPRPHMNQWDGDGISGMMEMLDMQPWGS